MELLAELCHQRRAVAEQREDHPKDSVLEHHHSMPYQLAADPTHHWEEAAVREVRRVEATAEHQQHCSNQV